ncbi:MAG TPA: hypothetical protein DC049_17955 [Spirochaetia bacterium]|nr:hypothetical protein [Spirochaetia bacterium]
MMRIIILLLFITILSADDFFAPDEVMDARIREGIEHIHYTRYNLALSNFLLIQTEYPEHPAGYFFYGAALEWIMADYRNFDYQDEYLSLMQKSIKFSEPAAKNADSSVWPHFFLGAAYGFQGIYLLKYGNWLKAFIGAQRGYRCFTRVTEINSDFYDVYYGFGLYYYWKSDKAKILFWLPHEDNKKLGIEYLELAAEKGRYVGNEAKDSLIRIHFNERDYDLVIGMAKDRMNEFPDYIFYYWYLCRACIEKKYWSDALNAAGEIERLLESSPYTGRLALVEKDYYLALINYHLENFTQSDEYCSRIIGIPGRESAQIPFYDEYRDKTKEIRRRLNKLPIGGNHE